MAKTIVVFGSTTGTCEDLAGRIAAKLGAEAVNVADLNAATLADADNIILGSSTWGEGDLQDDWYQGVDVVKAADLKVKKVALFGCGDKESYPDTFCGAVDKLKEAVEATGAEIVGEELKLDEMNEPDQTDAKIDAWTASLGF